MADLTLGAGKTATAGNGQVGRRVSRSTRDMMVGLSQFALVGVAFAITRIWKFTSGSDLGYNLGLIGGLMMLILLVYPLRKRVKFMANWGGTKPWFMFHMTMGLAGPVLVLAHTNFHWGSMNAAICLLSMILVAGSGIIGRYIYVAIHHDLTGERMNLGDLQREAGFQGDEVHSRLSFAPEVEVGLRAFEARVLQQNTGNGFVAFLRFLMMGFRARAIRNRSNRLLVEAVRRQAAIEGWDAGRQARRLHNGRVLVDAYLQGVTRVAQFNMWVRLFSLWHVAHVPLVYMLALTAAAHVVAVHMY